MAHDHSGGLYPAAAPAASTPESARRPAHLLTRDAEATHGRAEETWGRGTCIAKALVKEPGLRIVVIVLGQGGRREEQRAPGQISLQTLTGRCLPVLDQTAGCGRRASATRPHRPTSDAAGAGHAPAHWAEFRAPEEQGSLDDLAERGRSGPLTLVPVAGQAEISTTAVLRRLHLGRDS